MRRSKLYNPELILEDYLTTNISILSLSKKYKTGERLISKLLKENNILIILKPLSEETKKKMSLNHTDVSGKNNPFFGKHHSEKAKKQLSESKKGENNYWFGKHHSEESKKKMSAATKGKDNKGEKNPMFGKHHSRKTKQKIAKALTGLNAGEKHPNFGKHLPEEQRKKISNTLSNNEAIKGKNNPSYGKRGKESPNFGSHRSEKTKKKLSIITKKRWQDPDFVRKQMKAKGVSPNKTELYLQELLNKWLPKEFKYVGDGEFILAGKCPDFVNVNGKKQLIELFGDWWHGFEKTGRTRLEEEQQRIEHFEKYGYQTLIIWEHELKDLDSLKTKILEFV